MENDGTSLPQDNLCYTGKFRMIPVQSECWTDSFVKTEEEVRFEIVDPAARICRLCRRLSNVWVNCFTDTGELSIDPQRLAIPRLLNLVVLTFEADCDAVICDFCCDKMKEIAFVRSLWPDPPIQLPMVSIPASQAGKIAEQADTPVMKQEANDNNSTDSPVIEEPPAESCDYPNPCAALDAVDNQMFPAMVDINNEPVCFNVNDEAPPVHAPDQTSNDGIPTIDLTCCDEEMTSRDDNSVDEELEKERLIRKALRLVKRQLKANRLTAPEPRRSKRLRHMTS